MTIRPHDSPSDSSRTDAETLQDTPPAGVEPKDADRPEAKPHGTLKDQVSAMEGEGQAQPQADEVPPEERDAGAGGRKRP